VRSFADRDPLLIPLLVVVVAFMGYLAPGGSLPADIDGDGDEVLEFMPFMPLVWIPGGRFIFDCTAVAEGAMTAPLRNGRCYSDQSDSRNALATLLRCSSRSPCPSISITDTAH
jgi:hypothetical protein